MLRLVHRGIGASGSVAFCTTVGVIERSGKLRSNTLINNVIAPRGCRPALHYLSPNGDPITVITGCALIYGYMMRGAIKKAVSLMKLLFIVAGLRIELRTSGL